MEIGGTKSEVAHGTKLQGCPQAVGGALIGVNEGAVMLGEGKVGDEVPLRNLTGERGQSFVFFER
jgi:hypothetical protein